MQVQDHFWQIHLLKIQALQLEIATKNILYEHSSGTIAQIKYCFYEIASPEGGMHCLFKIIAEVHLPTAKFGVLWLTYLAERSCRFRQRCLIPGSIVHVAVLTHRDEIYLMIDRTFCSLQNSFFSNSKALFI